MIADLNQFKRWLSSDNHGTEFYIRMIKALAEKIEIVEGRKNPNG